MNVNLEGIERDTAIGVHVRPDLSCELSARGLSVKLTADEFAMLGTLHRRLVDKERKASQRKNEHPEVSAIKRTKRNALARLRRIAQREPK